MDVFRREDLRQLLNYKGSPCVSLFMPTVQAGHETQQNPIRLRNLAKQAEAKLEKRNVPSAVARKLIDSILQLNEAGGIWTAPSKGLAVFVAPDFVAHWRVPRELKEEVFVDDYFHVTPLLPLLQHRGRYYLLTISQSQAALYEGTDHSLRKLELDSLPKSLKDALRIDEYVDSIQFHTSGQQQAGGTEPVGRKATVWHGHGAGTGEEKKRAELLEYFHRVAHALREQLNEEQVPLVFAGVEYLFPLFKEACHYSNLVPEPVKGNPDHLSEAELHEKSWQVVEPFLKEREQTLIDRYKEAAGSDRTVERIEQVVPASQQGAVDVLFVRDGSEVFGRINPQTGEVLEILGATPTSEESASQPSDNGQPSLRELIDYASVQTLLHGGQVLVLEPERMPTQNAHGDGDSQSNTESMVGALLRFPLPQTGK